MYREQYGEDVFGCLGIKGRYCDVGAYLSGKNGNVSHLFLDSNAGVSRSVTVVLGYLMSSKRLLLEEAMKIVKNARPSAKPNVGFLHQLKDYQTRLHLH